MTDRTPQQVSDELRSLAAKAINIVQGTIAGAANPGGSIAFTYRNPIDGQTYTAEGTAWNQCSPSQVSALKLEDGSWVLVGAHESATVREVVHTDRRARIKKPEGLNVTWFFRAVNGAAWSAGEDKKPVPKSNEIRGRKKNVVRIDYEDASNCGGSNGEVQSGFAIAQIKTPRLLQLQLSAEGLVETENPGYETIALKTVERVRQGLLKEVLEILPGRSFTFGGQDPPRLKSLYEGASVSSGGGCKMELLKPKKVKFQLPPGTHLLIFHSSTKDAAYHVGAYWQIKLDL